MTEAAQPQAPGLPPEPPREEGQTGPMEASPPLRRRFWTALAAFAAAPLAALLVALLLGWLQWPAAVLVGAAVLLGSARLLLNHTRHMRSLIRYVEEFRRSVDYNAICRRRRGRAAACSPPHSTRRWWRPRASGSAGGASWRR